MTESFRIVYTIADLQPESGGPTRSVAALAESVLRCCGASVEVEVVALDYGDDSNPPMRPKEPVRTTLVSCGKGMRRKAKWTPSYLKTLSRRLKEPAVLLHDNGLWLPTNHAAAKAARLVGVPFISSPRGMLTGWAWKYRAFKKRVAWHLYQRRNLQVAKVLHATSQAEAHDFRARGLRQPIAVIPNGVELPANRAALNGDGHDSRTALFLSRIHPNKGLLHLVEAWDIARPAGWKVIVAGGDEVGHRAEVEFAIHERGLDGVFRFVGEVADGKKWELYRSAELFVLPTKSENFGIAVAEALACELPVITTKGAPWEELQSHGCGWWVEPTSFGLAAALREACKLSERERREMGLRGRKLVETNYTWPAAAAKMVAVYRWMLGLAGRPECVLNGISPAN